MQHFPKVADAGSFGPKFGAGSDAQGLHPLGDPPGSLALFGEHAALR
jgi:hypothetical protein